jgi:pimeloyl-ACP methyl ester carboxylesterase
MSNRWPQRILGSATVLAGLAAGAATGLAAERRVVRKPRTRPDSAAREPFGALPYDRTGVVVADDGVELRYEEVGPEDAPLTIVLVHGWTLEMAAWHFQRTALTAAGRVVLFDHRGHGRSGATEAAHATIDQLGSDLERVIAERAPDGPLMLVGHSMGGMTIMALAQRRPDLFADGGRVRAVGLLSTSTGHLAELTFGVPAVLGTAVKWSWPRLLVGIGGPRARYVDPIRRRGLNSDIAHVLTRYLTFGGSDVPPSYVDFADRMITATSTLSTSAFATALLSHDKLAALPLLKAVPTLVLVGGDDRLTPPDHSRLMAAELGANAELVILPGAGHMAMLERAPLVNVHLLALAARAVDPKPVA